MSDDKDTCCPVQQDGQHCNCWQDGDPCCACGDVPAVKTTCPALNVPRPNYPVQLVVSMDPARTGISWATTFVDPALNTPATLAFIYQALDQILQLSLKVNGPRGGLSTMPVSSTVH